MLSVSFISWCLKEKVKENQKELKKKKKKEKKNARGKRQKRQKEEMQWQICLQILLLLCVILRKVTNQKQTF